MGPLNLTGKGIKNSKGLAISDLVLQCDYPTIFDNFDILRIFFLKLKKRAHKLRGNETNTDTENASN